MNTGRGDNRSRGEAGEQAASAALKRDGWTVLEQNLRVGRTEIDLVAERDGTIAFIEVKARRPDASVSPGEAVDDAKVRRIARAAETWLARRSLENTPWMLLLAAVRLDEQGNATSVTWEPLEED
ncbi:MAG: YraN family protein [Planctomycetota bacterium]